MTIRLGVARGLAAVVAVMPVCVASPAQAVSPPPVDDTLLPRSAPARPPRPTVQRTTCAVTSMQGQTVSAQLTGLDLAQVWRLTRGAGQSVAVIDTGVAPHPRLPHLRGGGDFVSGGDGTQDCDGHGTAVAGIVAAQPDPNDGFSGVAPEARVIGIRQSSSRYVAAHDATATGFGDIETMARAVRAAADAGATIINISSVACTRADAPPDDRALGAALRYAVDTRDVVVVAAAGNTGPGQCPAQHPDPTWESATVLVSPAWYDDYVLTVGSVDAHGEPSEFTLAGPWVDVAAPGETVLSLSSSGDGLADGIRRDDDWAPLAGTSYAAPVVSGIVALIRSRFPTWTARTVMQRIAATAHPRPGGRDPRVGAGVVDALAAVSTDILSPPPRRTTAPIVSDVTSGQHGSRNATVTGVAICSGLSVAIVVVGALRARSRRPGHDRVDSD